MHTGTKGMTPNRLKCVTCQRNAITAFLAVQSDN